MSGCPWKVETCTSNVKSIALTVLEILLFNGQKFSESHDPAMSHFRTVLRGHVRTVPENMRVKCEVRIFNRFGAISIDRSPAHRQTDTHPKKTGSPSFTLFAWRR